jgi:uncharacterized Zn-binding protein involved in type VI secretion
VPDAARISDHHLCPKVEPGPVPHVGGPIFSGSANVIVGYLPAARVRDRLVCAPIGPADTIRKGSSTVLINSRSAARRTDPTSHGGIIVVGCPTVVIGDDPQSFTMRAAAKSGTPFCEECERLRREQDEPAFRAFQPVISATSRAAEASCVRITCWVRVNQLWAGNGWGAMFLPRIGHEGRWQRADHPGTRRVHHDQLWSTSTCARGGLASCS